MKHDYDKPALQSSLFVSKYNLHMLRLDLLMQTDGLGRTRSISGDTSTQEIRYWLDGLTKSTSEENGALTQFDYDTRGRLLSVAAPAISGVSSTTNYAYLVDSLLDTVTDPAGLRSSGVTLL